MNLMASVELNDRISPEYLAMQKQLHEDQALYGTQSDHYVEDIRKLIAALDIKSVLDYGCGKGRLKKALGDIVREYDPAIPGKDAEPEQAGLLVCTDVLEHIEPDKLDSVLEHIRRLGRTIYLVIATRPAVKTLPDGRNAHLLVRDADWWKEKLGQTFDIKSWDPQPLGIVCVMKPYVLIGDIQGVGVMEYDKRLEHIRENIKATKKRVHPAKFIYYTGGQIPMFGINLGIDTEMRTVWGIPKPHSRVAIVMCYGPSLNDTWQMALDEKQFIQGSDIVSVSGAHDFLIERGVIPRYHIECDPRLHKGDMMKRIHGRVEYLMATVCHPELIKRLKGRKLRLWHMNEGEQSMKILEHEPNALLVPGGGSVGLRALALLYIMGYRRFLIHGMDCSYRDGNTHAGVHTGKKIEPIEVRLTDGSKFWTAPVLITYQRYFDELRQKFIGDADSDPTKIEVILRGNGLLQHWLKLIGGADTQIPTNEAA